MSVGSRHECSHPHNDGSGLRLRTNGFIVTVVEHPNMTLIKQKYGVREDLEGCHSTVIDGYVVEGHVPVTSIKRMLAEKPEIKGISLPGMPEGSPGMTGSKEGPFEILSISGDDKVLKSGFWKSSFDERLLSRSRLIVLRAEWREASGVGVVCTDRGRGATPLRIPWDLALMEGSDQERRTYGGD